MNLELDRQLVTKFPKIFVDRYADPAMSSLVFGFECGDGWYQLIYDLCVKLQIHADDMKSNIRALQVKEKFGTLRFYCSSDKYTDYIDEAIREAEKSSAVTCETCGVLGKLRNSKGWMYTSCDNHKRED